MGLAATCIKGVALRLRWDGSKVVSLAADEHNVSHWNVLFRRTRGQGVMNRLSSIGFRIMTAVLNFPLPIEKISRFSDAIFLPLLLAAETRELMVMVRMHVCSST
jgi:hypothetical protein